MVNLEELFVKMTEFLKTETRTETIIGQELKFGEFICLPIMSVGLGFGGSSMEGKGKGNATTDGEGTIAGGGIGLGITPIGFLVTKGSEIQFIPVNSSKGLSAAFEKLPNLLEKYLDKNKTVVSDKG